MGDLIRARVSEAQVNNQPIFLYPSNGTNYVRPSGLNGLSNKAAIYYSSVAPRRKSSNDAPQVLAFLGLSDFDYFISLLGLSKLGHTILFLSTSISEEAHVSLLNVSRANCLLIHDRLREVAETLQRRVTHLSTQLIASRENYSNREELSPDRALDPARLTNNVAWIAHSSGPTGLPVPSYQTRSAVGGSFKSQFLDLLASYCYRSSTCTVFRSIMNRKHVYLYHAALPLASQHLVKTLRKHSDIQTLYLRP